MDLSLSFLLLALFATFLNGVSKAGFGGAMGALAVPLLSLVISTPQAAAIMLPILLLLDAFGLLVFRGQANMKNLRIILPGGLLGLLFGMLFFEYVNLHFIKLVIGGEALWFGAELFYNAKKAITQKPPQKIKGTFFSVLSGFTSFISHSGGPPLLHYLLPQGLDRKEMVATTVVFFATINFFKIIPFAYLGLLDFTNLKISAYLAPAALLSYWFGMFLLKRIAQNTFNTFMASALVLTGIKLIFDALSALL